MSSDRLLGAAPSTLISRAPTGLAPVLTHINTRATIMNMVMSMSTEDRVRQLHELRRSFPPLFDAVEQTFMHSTLTQAAARE